MNRKEQIEEKAFLIYPDIKNGIDYDVGLRESFIDGAKWADANPASLATPSDVDKVRNELAKVKKEYLDYKTHYDRIFSASVVVPTEEYATMESELQKHKAIAGEWERLANEWREDHDKLKNKYEPMVAVISDDHFRGGA